MTEIPTCPTCGRVPSAACWGEVYYYEIDEAEVKHTRCPDPIHDLADQGPALKTERDELLKEIEHQKLRGDRLAERVDRAMAERDEARALVMEMFRRDCLVVDKDASASRSVYDHMASSTLREAQAALISWGMVKREECVRP